MACYCAVAGVGAGGTGVGIEISLPPQTALTGNLNHTDPYSPSAMMGGQKVDLRTPQELSRHFRDQVMRESIVQYAA